MSSQPFDVALVEAAGRGEQLAPDRQAGAGDDVDIEHGARRRLGWVTEEEVERQQWPPWTRTQPMPPCWIVPFGNTIRQPASATSGRPASSTRPSIVPG